jgi:hypothetical protein
MCARNRFVCNVQWLAVIVAFFFNATCFASDTKRAANSEINGTNTVFVAEEAASEPGSGLLLAVGVILLGSAAIGRKIRGSSDPAEHIEEQ